MMQEDRFDRKILAFIAAGIAIGFALMLLLAGGIAYGDRPSFCGSCHSMQKVYATWSHSNHKQFSCGDCHLPQNNLAYKLFVKAENGMRHSYHETLRDYPETIRLKPASQEILQANCRRCHASTIESTFMDNDGRQSCTQCHPGVAHEKTIFKGGIRLEQTP